MVRPELFCLIVDLSTIICLWLMGLLVWVWQWAELSVPVWRVTASALTLVAKSDQRCPVSKSKPDTHSQSWYTRLDWTQGVYCNQLCVAFSYEVWHKSRPVFGLHLIFRVQRVMPKGLNGWTRFSRFYLLCFKSLSWEIPWYFDIFLWVSLKVTQTR